MRTTTLLITLAVLAIQASAQLYIDELIRPHHL